MKNFSRVILFLAAFFLYVKSAQATSTLTEVQHLDFGEFAMKNNTSPHTIVVDPANSATYDPAIIPDGSLRAHRGQYTLSGLPPNMALTFGLATTNGTTTGGTTLDSTHNAALGINPVFTIGSYTANSPSTDSSGNATLFIGGTLTTSGDGRLYGDGTYDGTVNLTIYF